MEQNKTAKVVRFVTPSGHVWETKHPDGRVSYGESKVEAVNSFNTIDPRFEAIKNEVVNSYNSVAKPPMLIVGCNNWIREHIPYFVLQNYDLHMLFYPNHHGAWVMGVVGISRVDNKHLPMFSFAAGLGTSETMKRALWGSLSFQDAPEAEFNEKLLVWYQNWIYRCPKITFKDVIHLEAFKENHNLYKPTALLPVNPFQVFSR